MVERGILVLSGVRKLNRVDSPNENIHVKRPSSMEEKVSQDNTDIITAYLHKFASAKAPPIKGPATVAVPNATPRMP